MSPFSPGPHKMMLFSSVYLNNKRAKIKELFLSGAFGRGVALLSYSFGVALTSYSNHIFQ